MEIPQPDPVALARMQYEKENFTKPGTVKRSTAFLTRGPDVAHAAKSGAPAMSTLKPSIPASVPIPVEAALAAAGGPVTPAAAAVPAGTTDVTISNDVAKGSSLDTKPDARMAPPGSTPAAAAAPVAAASDPLPVNHTGNQKKLKSAKGAPKTEVASIKKPKQKKEKKAKPETTAPATPATTTPAATTPPATTTAK
jgi:hypothetical protein